MRLAIEKERQHKFESDLAYTSWLLSELGEYISSSEGLQAKVDLAFSYRPKQKQELEERDLTI